ncbi:hypothetical protein HBB16_21170 [Pseudonocardia sp. MCCB 268]|nr:hypothetical protein [Pseudonocardia cytotoxica]
MRGSPARSTSWRRCVATGRGRRRRLDRRHGADRRRPPEVELVRLQDRRARPPATPASRGSAPPTWHSATTTRGGPGRWPGPKEILERYPDVGLVAGAVLVGPDRRPDPVNTRPARQPLGGTDPSGVAGLPGLRGRRPETGLRRGERVLALLPSAPRRRCWPSTWRPGAGGCATTSVVALHHPSPHRMPHEQRCALEARNRLLIAR